MKGVTGTCLLLAISGSLFSAADPKDDVLAAAKKLGNQANYSWKTTVVVPEGAPFRQGPSEGKTVKDGLMQFMSQFGDAKLEVVAKGEKVAVLNFDGAWQPASELENEQGPARFFGMFARNVRTPAVQAAELATLAKELKKDGDAVAGDLTEDGAKTLLRFRRGNDGPAVSNAKGNVKYWLKDGELIKFEYRLQGTINFSGNDIDVDRTNIVEIKDIGKTTLDVAEAAKKIVQ